MIPRNDHHQYAVMATKLRCDFISVKFVLNLKYSPITLETLGIICQIAECYELYCKNTTFRIYTNS